MKYFRPYLGLLLASFMLALAINLAVLARPYILKIFIDDYLRQEYFVAEIFISFGLLYFFLIIFESALSYLQTLFLTRIGQNITADIRRQLFSHIQRMRMAFFDRNSTGRLLTRLTGDIDALDEVYSGLLINLVKDLIMIVGIFAAMAAMDGRLTLITLFIFPLIVILIFLYRTAARKNFLKMKTLSGKINGFLAENIAGIKTVKIFGREKQKLEEFRDLNDQYFRTGLTQIILNSLGRPLIDVVNGLCIAAILYYSAGKIFSAHINIGVLTAFIAYIKQFFEPISEIAEKYTNIQSAAVSAKRIFEILDNKEDQEDMESGLKAESLEGKIEFRNVCFSYDNNRMVLKNISFKINPGETVAIVGSTGSGKTTLINLISGFYKSQQGKILLDDRPVEEYNLNSLRKRISVVMQDVFLFAGSIRDNITLNNPAVTEEDIITACRQTGSSQFIENLPLSYDTQVTEGGKTFSSGQRQLISFARAIAANPSILILDEATSHIDTQSEQMIQKAMNNMKKGRTTIIIAHRLSTIRNADKILVIENGELAEEGSHNELMALGGRYRQFYETFSSHC